MLKASITEGDIYEDLRLKLHTKRLDNILEIHLEKQVKSVLYKKIDLSICSKNANLLFLSAAKPN